jgi:hypothetical protein
MQRGRKIANVAMASKLVIHLYWTWPEGRGYDQVGKFGSHAAELGNRCGVPSQGSSK